MLHAMPMSAKRCDVVGAIPVCSLDGGSTVKKFKSVTVDNVFPAVSPCLPARESLHHLTIFTNRGSLYLLQRSYGNFGPSGCFFDR